MIFKSPALLPSVGQPTSPLMSFNLTKKLHSVNRDILYVVTEIAIRLFVGRWFMNISIKGCCSFDFVSDSIIVLSLMNVLKWWKRKRNIVASAIKTWQERLVPNSRRWVIGRWFVNISIKGYCSFEFVSDFNLVQSLLNVSPKLAISWRFFY
jgi:hypothetical protein